MNNIEKEFFKGKNVLITGHTGFKGSWLTLILNILGSNIMGISLKPNSKNDMYVISKIDQICNSKILNICDVKKSSKLVKDFEPDLIFHLAAQPLVIQSYKYAIWSLVEDGVFEGLTRDGHEIRPTYAGQRELLDRHVLNPAP